MGAVYYTELSFKPKKGCKESDIANAIEKWIARNNGTWCTFNDADIAALNGTLPPALDAVYPGIRKTDTGEWQAGFEASYGWERVQKEVFETMAPFLRPGSNIYIEPDNDWVKGTVLEDGSVSWSEGAAHQ